MFTWLNVSFVSIRVLTHVRGLHEAYWFGGDCGLDLEFAVDTIPFHLSISSGFFHDNDNLLLLLSFFDWEIQSSFFWAVRAWSMR